VYIPNANVTLGVEPRGGAFIDVISPWLVKLNSTNWKDDATARASLPPPLMREGEKTQPGWLFQFLRNPYPLRPIVVLRMPRFNLSDADAQALVDYFAAVDRLSNPGIGLNAPYLTVTQRDQGYLIERNRDYLAHLEKVKGKQGLEERAKLWRPAWEVDLKDRLNQVAQELRLAEAAVERASKPDDKKAAEALRDKLKSQLDALAEEAKQTDKMGPYLTTLRETWERESVYATDAWRLLADRNSCISCHPLGRIAPSNNVGPSLVYAPERLRPDWTQRWIANPQRLLIYKSGLNPMPQFFSLEKPDKATLEMFPGSVLDHSGAIRDVLMNFHQVLNLPENRIATPAPPAGGN
jgi:mono/diheme cytochrome c family protein